MLPIHTQAVSQQPFLAPRVIDGSGFLDDFDDELVSLCPDGADDDTLKFLLNITERNCVGAKVQRKV